MRIIFCSWWNRETSPSSRQNLSVQLIFKTVSNTKVHIFCDILRLCVSLTLFFDHCGTSRVINFTCTFYFLFFLKAMCFASLIFMVTVGLSRVIIVKCTFFFKAMCFASLILWSLWDDLAWSILHVLSIKTVLRICYTKKIDEKYVFF